MGKHRKKGARKTWENLGISLAKFVPSDVTRVEAIQKRKLHSKNWIFGINYENVDFCGTYSTGEEPMASFPIYREE